jgi:vanillate O-demethylase monooxygenase subunit
MDEPVVLYRKADGGIAAVEDRCPHRFAPLSMGKVVAGDRIQCPYHGLEFDGSGACVKNPHGTKNIPPRARVKSYPVLEKHQAVWIWMGEQPADPAKVPDFSVLDDVPDLYTTKRDNIVIQANYQLIIDNLLDLSHTSYLHDGILGNADTVESDISVEQDGDDVVVGRYATNSTPPGMFAPFWPNHPPRVDKFTKMRWMAPSTLRLISGICQMGAQQDSGTGYHAIHMLTPLSERSTHYFFTAVRWGILTEDEKLDRDLQERIAKMRRFAFEEQDAPVIEAQQRIIESAERPLEPLILAIDVGPVRYKRILNKMIDAEQS